MRKAAKNGIIWESFGGLKLEARKGPVEVVVIDHVEKPSVD
jgi:uncharacterized protein (TIGR03435 family)